MGQDPDMIRRDIENTRDRMGDTVDALGYKTDVKERAGDKVGELKERVTGAAPSSGDMEDGAKKAVGIAQENPLGLAVGSIAVGFVAGLLVPGTRVENAKMGQMADQVKGQMKDTAHEAMDHGKQVAQETAQAAGEKAKEHAGDVKETAQENAQSVGAPS